MQNHLYGLLGDMYGQLPQHMYVYMLCHMLGFLYRLNVFLINNG